MSSPEQLALAARTCPVLATAQTLAEWIGAGREVTTRGVLKPAAAVEACDLLGIEAPSRKPRSALDIAELMMVWTAASAAGFIEVSGGRVTPGPTLQPWLEGAPDTVLAAWCRCVLGSLGLVDETDEDDLAYLAVLATFEERGGTVSLSELSEGIAQLSGDASAGCSCPDCAQDEMSWPPSDPDAEDAVRALGEFGIAVLRGDAAELTPLGHWLTEFMFRENAPPADAEAEVLARELTPLPPKVAALMARPWLSARTAVAAARELLAAGEAASGQDRLTALDLARRCGPEAAPAWREWATRDGFGAYARVWLAEQDDTEPADADAAWITVDALATMLDALPPEIPEELLPALIQAQGGAVMAEALPLLESCDHPAAPRLVKLLSGQVNPTGLLAGMLPGAAAFPVATVRRRRPGPVVTPPAGTAYQIKVQLRGVTKPPVWRRLQVPADLSLDQLHEVIQTAMGWHDCHMHLFSDGWNDYGRPDGELGHEDERNVRLFQLLTSVGDKIGYNYDFGDDWLHDITLEKILPAGAGVTSPVCTAGKGACPPEDCGGVWGYEELKATLADPDAEEHDDMLEWLGLASGDDFDPKEFSTEEVNRRLASTARR
jgi:hypothetical protein